MSSTQGRFNKGPLDPEAKNPEKNHVAGKLRAIQEERPNSVKKKAGEGEKKATKNDPITLKKGTAHLPRP